MGSEWEGLVRRLLDAAGLGERKVTEIAPLSGGVSSDIVVVTLDDRSRFCAKRALPALKVAGDWRAPVERSRFEAGWLKRADAIVPGSVPAVLAESEPDNALLMAYLPPADYCLWKTELLAGRWIEGAPEAVARTLARIHAATWGDAEVAAAFATDPMFDALRLDPYLRTLAERHPEVGGAILAVLDATASTRLALVHGDVSPKNILIHQRDGHPVFLDAECAWYGDPAFDAAFCLNHLLIKALHVSTLREQLAAGATAFLETWLGGLPAEERAAAERRVLALLPCLMLARVDGKSPVEYLSEAGREQVRALAPPFIRKPPERLAALFAAIGAAAANSRSTHTA